MCNCVNTISNCAGDAGCNCGDINTMVGMNGMKSNATGSIEPVKLDLKATSPNTGIPTITPPKTTVTASTQTTTKKSFGDVALGVLDFAKGFLGTSASASASQGATESSIRISDDTADDPNKIPTALWIVLGVVVIVGCIYGAVRLSQKQA